MRTAAATAFACLLALFPVVSAEHGAASTAACENLARSLSLPDTTITLSQAVAAGTFVPPGGGAAAAKAAASAAGVLSRDAEDRAVVGLGHQIRSLAADVGLERQVSAGRQRRVGRIDSIRRRSATRCVAATPRPRPTPGHTGTDASFAMGHPEKLIDFGYRSVHETAVQGKATVAALYGEKPRVSYFNGCSGGGRMSFMEAQRFPGDFDGIIAGAPGYNRTDVAFQTLGMAQATHVSPESFIPAGKYPGASPGRARDLRRARRAEGRPHRRPAGVPVRPGGARVQER